MPESKKRQKVVDKQKAQVRRSQNKNQVDKRSPRWWAPLMVALAIIGLLIVVTAYVTNGRFPIPGLSNGNINLFIGIGFMLAGFFMTAGWK